jgi:PD-(D/E)XK nuclease superfamily
MAKKILKIDSQILDAFSKCERLFQISFIENLRKKDESYSIDRGSLCHDILQKYYLEYKASRNKIASQIKGIEYGRSRVNHYEAIDVPRGMSILDNMREYFNYYMNERWLPIDVEKIHKKVIYEDDEITVLYVGKIDVSVTGESADIPLMPIDHKTYDRWFEPLATENQFTGYAVLLDVKHITVNKIGFQTTYPPEKKFRRVKLTYTEERKYEWIHNTAAIAKDIVFALENNRFPMRRTQCGLYGGCKGLDICNIDPRARDGIKEKLYKVTEDWNPEASSHDGD